MKRLVLVLFLGVFVFGDPFSWRNPGADPLWPGIQKKDIPQLVERVKTILIREMGEKEVKELTLTLQGEITISPGEKFEFMIYGKPPKPKVERQVLYEGKEKLPAFLLKTKGWEIIIPQICGNILGRKVAETPEVKVEVKSPVKEEKPEVKEEEKPELKPPVEEKPEVKEERSEGVVEEEKIAQNINLNVKVKVDFPTPPQREEKKIGPSKNTTLLIVGVVLLGLLLLRQNEQHVTVINNPPNPGPNPPDVNTRFLPIIPIRF